jgi:hypothetical protein
MNAKEMAAGRRPVAELDDRGRGRPARAEGSMSDLHDTDVVAWSERQAALLRRRAAGELVNEAEIDWSNVAEEIDDLGKSEVRSVRSHIKQALLHDLKAEAWPRSRDVPHWRAEARLHRDEARDDYTATMADKIDLAKIYRQALRGLPETIDDVPPLPVPTVCPLTLAELLTPEPDEDDGAAP